MARRVPAKAGKRQAPSMSSTLKVMKSSIRVKAGHDENVVGVFMAGSRRYTDRPEKQGKFNR